MLNDKIVKELPPAPKDVVEWIIKNAPRKTYLIFDKKKNEVRCSRCGCTFTIEECVDNPVKHNGKTVCPHCKHDAEYKESRYGRKSLAEHGRVLIFVRKRQTIYASLSEYIIDYQGEKPAVSACVTDIYKLNKKEQKRVQLCTKWDTSYGGWHKDWYEQKNIILPSLPNGGFYYDNKFERVSVYDKNFSIFEKSDFKYDDVKNVCEKYNLSAYRLIEYLDLCAKYPAIEMLRKGGFEQIFKDRVCRGIRGGIYLRGTTLKKILRLSDMGEVRKWANTGINIDQLETYNMLKYCGLQCNSIADIDKGAKWLPYYHEKNGIKYIEKFVTMKRAVKYFKSQPEDEHRHYRIANDYIDYLMECEELEMNLDDERILFPKSLEEAHRKTSREAIKKRERERKKAVQEEQKRREAEREAAIGKVVDRAKIMSKFNYSNGELLIRIAETAEEIEAEGKAMHHCVGGYVVRHASGMTNIFLIRKVSNPDKPFYTLELSEGSERKVVQCRGKCNSGMTDEVKAFVDEWIENVVNKKKIKEAA